VSNHSRAGLFGFLAASFQQRWRAAERHHRTGCEMMGSPTLQTLQDPILLLEKSRTFSGGLNERRRFSYMKKTDCRYCSMVDDPGALSSHAATPVAAVTAAACVPRDISASLRALSVSRASAGVCSAAQRARGVKRPVRAAPWTALTATTHSGEASFDSFSSSMLGCRP
jgi:hypothetical protein